MKKILSALLPLLLFTFACNHTPDANKVLDKFAQANKNAFHIVWTLSYKSAMHNDTSTSLASAWTVKNDADTNWYGHILVKDQNGNLGIYYNGQGFEYNKSGNVLVLYPQKYAEYAAYMNKSDFIKYLLNPGKLREVTNDTANKVTVLDTTYNGTPAWAIKINLPDNADMHNRSKIFFFDKEQYNLLGIENKSYIIWGWSWNSVKIDSVNPDINPQYISQTLENLKKTAKIDTLKIDEDEGGYDLLQIGTLAPEVYGHVYQTKDTFLLSQQNAQLYVIDFWFQTCQPCMRAIPYLMDLYKKYKDKGLLVIGVNSVDNNPDRYGYLKKFIEFKKITYPIIMTERKVDLSYKVPGYPTVYVLDKDKHIIYHEVGFDPDKKLREIDSIVTNYFK